MIVVAIKFSNGTYYAGCNKQPARTILGAQLYRSEKTAQNVIDKSVNYPSWQKNPQIIKVKIEEV